MHILIQSFIETHDCNPEEVTGEQLYFYLNSLPLVAEGQRVNRDGTTFIETIVTVMGEEVVYLRAADAANYNPSNFNLEEDVIVCTKIDEPEPSSENPLGLRGSEDPTTEQPETINVDDPDNGVYGEHPLFDPQPFQPNNAPVQEEVVETEYEVVEEDKPQQPHKVPGPEMMSMDEFIQEKYIQKKDGTLIPIENVPQKKRDFHTVVKKYEPRAKEISELISKLKEDMDTDFAQLEESYPELKKFKRSYSVKSFDEKLKVVKQKDNYRFYEDGTLMSISLN